MSVVVRRYFSLVSNGQREGIFETNFPHVKHLAQKLGWHLESHIGVPGSSPGTCASGQLPANGSDPGFHVADPD